MMLLDGTRLATGLTRGRNNTNPELNYPYLLRGTVFGVRYPDDPKSRSKKFMEYDVVLWGSRQIIRNVPFLSLRNGTQDGDVVVLRAASSADFLRSKDFTDNTDGDIVLIVFIGGRSNMPLIVGCYPHPAGTIITTAADGEVRRIKHKGATIEINKNGEVTVESVGGASAFLDQTGNATVTVPSGKQLKLGSSGANEALLLGTTWRADWTTFVTALETAFTALLAAFTPATGLQTSAWTAPADEATAAAAMTAAAAACATELAAIPNEVSQKVFTEKGP